MTTTNHGTPIPDAVDRATMDRLRRGLDLEPSPPSYVYVASSWRNADQPAVVAALEAAGIDCYDFRHPAEGNEGFSWRQVGSTSGYDGPGITPKGQDLVDVDTYRRMLDHPRAVHGFDLDFAAMMRADAFVLVLPCGRSAHLELGWAVGAGKRTAIILEDPAEPELMFRMVDFLAHDVDEVLEWFGAGR